LATASRDGPATPSGWAPPPELPWSRPRLRGTGWPSEPISTPAGAGPTAIKLSGPGIGKVGPVLPLPWLVRLLPSPSATWAIAVAPAKQSADAIAMVLLMFLLLPRQGINPDAGCEVAPSERQAGRTDDGCSGLGGPCRGADVKTPCP